MRAGHIERPALRPADCAGAKRAAIAPIDAGGEIGSLRNGRSINVSRHFAAELQALLRGNRYAGAADGAHAPNAAAVKFCEPQPAVGAHGNARSAAVAIAAGLLRRNYAQGIRAR